MAILSYDNQITDPIYCKIRCMESANFYEDIFFEDASAANESIITDVVSKGKALGQLIIKGFNAIIALIKNFIDKIKKAFIHKKADSKLYTIEPSEDNDAPISIPPKLLPEKSSAIPSITEDGVAVYDQFFHVLKMSISKLIKQLHEATQHMQRDVIPCVLSNFSDSIKNRTLEYSNRMFDEIFTKINSFTSTITDSLNDDVSSKKISYIHEEALDQLLSLSIQDIEETKSNYEKMLNSIIWVRMTNEMYSEFSALSNKLLAASSRIITYELNTYKKILVNRESFTITR